MPAGDQLNCIEFRRQLLTDPRRLSSGAVEHRKRCSACAEFLARLARLESKLAAAVCVPVPEGLADRVLLILKWGKARAQKRLAAAASVVLAAGLSVLITSIPLYQEPALAAIDHVLHDEPQELLAGRAGDRRVLAHLLSESGLSIPAEGVAVRYLGQCPFRGGIAYHVVLDTAFGKATLLITPHKALDSRIVTSGRGLSAALTPGRSGSYALVADSGEKLAHIESLLKSPAPRARM